MPNAIRDNPEERAMQPASREAVSLLPSQQDMVAFWASLEQAGTINTREQEMFGQGYSFESIESLYGGNTGGLAVRANLQ